MEWWEDPTVIVSLAGIVFAALAGFGGAIIGARIGGKAVTEAARLAAQEAQADRAEARRTALLAERKDAILALFQANTQFELALIALRSDAERTPSRVADMEPATYREAAHRAQDLFIMAPELREALTEYMQIVVDTTGAIRAYRDEQWFHTEEGTDATPEVPDFAGLSQRLVAVKKRLIDESWGVLWEFAPPPDEAAHDKASPSDA
jgi:hypothetical protein